MSTLENASSMLGIANQQQTARQTGSVPRTTANTQRNGGNEKDMDGGSDGCGRPSNGIARCGG